MSQSVFVIQCASIVPNLGANPVKYLAFDDQSGGYPWFPEQWTSAEFFKDYEKALKVVTDLPKENAAVYGASNNDPFSRHALPHFLRGIAGGRSDDDGQYIFAIAIVEVSGLTLLNSKIITRYVLEVRAVQFYNVPNKPPIIEFNEVLFDVKETA
jgi:hypothetical protein